MSDLAFLSTLALVEKSLERAQQQINLAKQNRQSCTAIDCSHLPLAVIEVLTRAIRGRGYMVRKMTGLFDGVTIPMLRVSWQLPDPQITLWG